MSRTLRDRYLLIRLIGEGGMAQVFSATDLSLDRTVAVKILNHSLNDPEFIEKFHAEAKAAGRLSHPNIVSIFDVGVDNDTHFIVMELVQGNSLKAKLLNSTLDILSVVRIAKDIANGLAHAHAHNLVHCDIKPHNILLTPDNRAKIADFGIARAISQSTVTYGGKIVGSVHYFSPEQAKGLPITPKSDIYSLGVLIYEMLTNHLPFTADNPVAIAMQHINNQPKPPSAFRNNIPNALENIVLRSLNKNPDLRPSSFDMIQALSNIEASLAVEHHTIIQPPPAKVSLPPKPVNPVKHVKPFFKSSFFIAAGFIVLLFGFAVGIFLSFGGSTVQEIAVPNVQGKQLTLARQIIEDERLRLNVSEIYDSNVPAGEVVKQDPEPGRLVKVDRRVTVFVSKGGEAIDMPDLVGLSKFAASERSKKLGLLVGSIYEKDSDKEPGTILAHDPAAGTKIHRGQFIDFTVSRGNLIPATPEPLPEPVIQSFFVPDVRNAGLEVAKSNIDNAGLTVGTITYQESSQAPGTVISQVPAPNLQVDAGTPVDLVVAHNNSDDDFLPVDDSDAPSRDGSWTKQR